MSILEVQDAHKSFGATSALCGLSFALREGEMLALLGPNGAGKTTLIRALAGRVRLRIAGASRSRARNSSQAQCVRNSVWCRRSWRCIRCSPRGRTSSCSDDCMASPGDI